MNLTVDYELDNALWGSLPFPAPQAGLLSFSLLQFLSSIGTLTTLSYPVEFDLSRIHAFFRYAWLFAAPGPLRLRDSISEVDFHQKTLISDELGVGVSGLVASQLFGVRYFADAYPFLKKYAPIAYAGGSGRTKTPDFIGLDNAGNFFVIEAKGTQSGGATVRKQVRSGRIQKSNVIFSGGITPVRMVVATKFSRASHRFGSSTQAFDPVPMIKFSDEDRELVRREHFLKVISSAGVRIKRNDLLDNNYSFDKGACVPIKILEHDGIGTSFVFRSDVLIGGKTEKRQEPYRYVVTFGVSSQTFAAAHEKTLLELTQKAPSEFDIKKQVFSLVRNDGWMMDIRMQG